MKFLICLATYFLLLNGYATAQSLIQDSCKKASASSPNIKYDFCVTSLQQDPQSRTATSLEGLTVASTMNAASKMASMKRTIQNILIGKKFPGIEAALRACVELYGDGGGSLSDALKSVRSLDYGSANVHLSAALDDTATCETGFKDVKQQSPVANDNNVLFQKILIPLAFTNML